MSEAQIRQLLVGIVQAADPAADVFDHDRFDEDADRHVELLKVRSTTSGIHAWIVTGTPIEPTPIGWDDEGARYGKLWRYTYELRLLYGRDVSAETEKTSLALAIGVMHALDRSAILHGTTTPDAGEPLIQPTPGAIARLDKAALFIFKGSVYTVCHRWSITQQITELLS